MFCHCAAVVLSMNIFQGRERRTASFSRVIPGQSAFASGSLPGTGKPFLADGLYSGPKVGQSVEVVKIVARKKTAFKDMLLLNSSAYGKVLMFDRNTQITEKDGFVYYEMCSHVPLFCHPNPEDILIVGGLDGSWLARELLKHPSVKRVVHLEQDLEMIDFLKENFHASDFDYADSRFEFHDEDPKAYLKQCHEEFDVIITDCSAPPAESDGLFGESYYELVKEALKPDGVTITQSWGLWVELEPPTDVLVDNLRWAQNFFPSVSYYIISMPSVASGQAGNIICSKSEGVDFSKPSRKLEDATASKWELKYYNPEIHRAAFALPQFAKAALPLGTSSKL